MTGVQTCALPILVCIRAETLASLEQANRASGTDKQQVSGPRAEFWKLRGLRGGKKNVRHTRDDLLQLTIQGKFPAYERVLLREGSRTFLLFVFVFSPKLMISSTKSQFVTASNLLTANFKRPIVILGPLNDVAMERLASDMPDNFEVAGMSFPVVHSVLLTEQYWAF